MQRLNVIEFDCGDQVLCDICDADYTNDDAHGGFLFGSKAVCPKCEPRLRASITRYNEQQFIKAECPPHLSFRDFVYAIREQGI